jgi:hypothetical protein
MTPHLDVLLLYAWFWLCWWLLVILMIRHFNIDSLIPADPSVQRLTTHHIPRGSALVDLLGKHPRYCCCSGSAPLALVDVFGPVGLVCQLLFVPLEQITFSFHRYGP